MDISGYTSNNLLQGDVKVSGSVEIGEVPTSYKLPDEDGSAGQSLVTDGKGGVEWGSPEPVASISDNWKNLYSMITPNTDYPNGVWTDVGLSWVGSQLVREEDFPIGAVGRVMARGTFSSALNGSASSQIELRVIYRDSLEVNSAGRRTEPLTVSTSFTGQGGWAIDGFFIRTGLQFVTFRLNASYGISTTQPAILTDTTVGQLTNIMWPMSINLEAKTTLNGTAVFAANADKFIIDLSGVPNESLPTSGGVGTEDHLLLDNLTGGVDGDGGHPQFALLNGRTGGQTLDGDTVAGGSLSLKGNNVDEAGDIKILSKLSLSSALLDKFEVTNTEISVDEAVTHVLALTNGGTGVMVRRSVSSLQEEALALSTGTWIKNIQQTMPIGVQTVLDFNLESFNFTSITKSMDTFICGKDGKYLITWEVDWSSSNGFNSTWVYINQDVQGPDTSMRFGYSLVTASGVTGPRQVSTAVLNLNTGDVIRIIALNDTAAVETIPGNPLSESKWMCLSFIQLSDGNGIVPVDDPSKLPLIGGTMTGDIKFNPAGTDLIGGLSPGVQVISDDLVQLDCSAGPLSMIGDDSSLSGRNSLALSCTSGIILENNVQLMGDLDMDPGKNINGVNDVNAVKLTSQFLDFENGDVGVGVPLGSIDFKGATSNRILIPINRSNAFSTVISDNLLALETFDTTPVLPDVPVRILYTDVINKYSVTIDGDLLNEKPSFYGYVSQAALTTTLPAGVVVVANLGLGVTADYQSSFIVGVNGRVTYSGTRTRRVKCTAVVSYSVDEKSTDIRFVMKKNSVFLPGSLIQITTRDVGSKESGTLNFMPEMSTGDFLELWAGTEDDTVVLTISDFSFCGVGLTNQF